MWRTASEGASRCTKTHAEGRKECVRFTSNLREVKLLGWWALAKRLRNRV